MIFQSTPSPRRETTSPSATTRRTLHFNPLPPQGGRRLSRKSLFDFIIFQSTPSPRRETVVSVWARSIYRFQSTPSPRRETRLYVSCFRSVIFQSTPSPRRETARRNCRFGICGFQSTPSPRRETISGILGNVDLSISIHSLPKEGDIVE